MKTATSTTVPSPCGVQVVTTVRHYCRHVSHWGLLPTNKDLSEVSVPIAELLIHVNGQPTIVGPLVLSVWECPHCREQRFAPVFGGNGLL